MNIAKAGTLIAGVLALTTPAMGDNLCLDTGGGGEREAQWLYDSPLCVEETITDLGGGVYEYSYAFVNVDTAHIWHFGVWSNFTVVNSNATWDTHPEWGHAQQDIGVVLPPYDGRNLDPGISQVAFTWGPDWPNTTDPINPTEAVGGFSYLAPEFDDSPKWYFYETVEGGAAPENGGFLAAVGMTCSPTPTEVTTWGRIKAIYE